MVNSLIRVPFRRPLSGPSNPLHNLGQTVTREIVRAFMGYSSSLPIEEFRSIEAGIDALAKFAMAPVVAAEGATQEDTVIGGVPGILFRPKGVEHTVGKIVYLHGGGYVGTSPNMYAFFTARLSVVTGCEVFVADYRLAPEFPFPAGLDDAISVIEHFTAEGVDPRTVFIAGDSGGGGLACSVIYHRRAEHLPRLGGALLFSPEIDLRLDQPSVTDNAPHDILPWNIPTAAYLHGEDANAKSVSAVDQNVHNWPPVYMCWGSKEMFRDSIRLLSDHIEDAPIQSVRSEADGMFHVYPILMPWAGASQEVYREVGEFVRERVTEASEARTDKKARAALSKQAKATKAPAKAKAATKTGATKATAARSGASKAAGTKVSRQGADDATPDVTDEELQKLPPSRRRGRAVTAD